MSGQVRTYAVKNTTSFGHVSYVFDLFVIFENGSSASKGLLAGLIPGFKSFIGNFQGQHFKSFRRLRLSEDLYNFLNCRVNTCHQTM